MQRSGFWQAFCRNLHTQIALIQYLLQNDKGSALFIQLLSAFVHSSEIDTRKLPIITLSFKQLSKQTALPSLHYSLRRHPFSRQWLLAQFPARSPFFQGCRKQLKNILHHNCPIYSMHCYGRVIHYRLTPICSKYLSTWHIFSPIRHQA